MNKVETNIVLVTTALDEAFNKRNMEAYEQYWSPAYIQHSAVVPPDREGLKLLMSSMPPEFRYEQGVITGYGDFVMVHGRYSGMGTPRAWVIVDIFRIEDGRLKEHWDVIQDEASRTESKGGHPMFGENFWGE